MKKLYLFLAIIGTVIPYYFVFSFFMQNGFNVGLFVEQLFLTFPSGNFVSDLLISIVVFLIFLSKEIKKYKMPNIWIFIGICCGVGLSCALPLFLYYREKSLEQ